MARADAKSISSPPKPAKPRLASLDALRGFDIFLLIFFDQIAHVFQRGPAPVFTEQTEFWSCFWRPLGALIDVPAGVAFGELALQCGRIFRLERIPFAIEQRFRKE